VSSAGQRRTLAGRYRLEEVIGRGGMSTVYRATDLSLDREVAVKVALDPMAEENPVYVARFKREARAAAALNHPGVVTVFDAGTDGATRYIVMEYVDGQNLSEVLREEGPLEPARAARIAAQIADTLAAAHAAGIVHRDIKPANVMLVRGGARGSGEDAADDRVKVLDFGIARTADGVSLTQTSSVLGTAPYMAPEQAMGTPADARSDIYSLGCVLYEMLTGKPPFMADVPAAVLHQHVRVAPKPAAQLNPSIPPALDALVLQMLAKAPGDRPQTAAEVRDRLAGFGRHAQTEPTRPLPAAGAIAAAAAAAAEVPQVATVAQAGTVPEPATVLPAPTAGEGGDPAGTVPLDATSSPRATGPPQRTPPPDRSPPPAATAGTRAMPPSRRRSSGPWAFLAVVAVLLLGAAVAYALARSGGAAQSSSSASHPSAPTSHSTVPPASHSTPAPTPNSSSSASTPSTPSSSSSSSTATTTTTITRTATTPPGPPGGTQPTPPAPGGTQPTPPAPGGAPPGQAKKGKTK
jgi:eukaryotic-like serine/threonine-protein kinase